MSLVNQDTIYHQNGSKKESKSLESRLLLNPLLALKIQKIVVEIKTLNKIEKVLLTGPTALRDYYVLNVYARGGGKTFSQSILHPEKEQIVYAIKYIKTLL